MTPELAERKLAAFLHDPPQKPFVLGRGHEQYAAAILEALTGRATIPESARQADHLASAADRPNFPASTPAVDFGREPALTHPLSERQLLRLEPLGVVVDPDAVSTIVYEAARDVAAMCGDDTPRRYLAAWRWLGAFIRAREAQAGLGALWEWLPADTRVPDHTIWDHMSVTAALAGTGRRPAFLVFAIGPVQGFIAQARSTRDLWAGSYLLSWLSWQAIRAMADAIGPDALLYPSLRGQPLVDAWLIERGACPPQGVPQPPAAVRRVAAFPNKLLALASIDAASELARRAEDAVRAAWRDLGAQVREHLASWAGERWQPERWDEQLARQVEVAWAALPWPAEGREAAWLEQARALLGPDALDSFERTLRAMQERGRYAAKPSSYYAPAHGLAQRAFDARKLARGFDQASEPGFKCTLCGLRAPALAGEAPFAEQREAWKRLAEKLASPELVALTGDERLCAVCLTKRAAPETPVIQAALGNEPPSFPSTSSLATLPFRRALIARIRTEPELAGAAERFVQAIERLSSHGRELGATVSLGRDVFPRLVHDAGPGLGQRLLRFDGEWLLEETYERRRRDLQQIGGSAEVVQALESAHEALRGLLSAARRRGLRAPSAYYALLLLDGDRMGRWVSGEQHWVTLGDLLHPTVREHLAGDPTWASLLRERRLFAPSTHAALGSILRDFALWVVPDVVERQHDGRVVYAGGDDVLALLPVDQALDVLDALRTCYTRSFLVRDERGRLLEGMPERAGGEHVVFRGMGPDATVSAGLLIAHHLLPLGLALEETRRLEERAKEEGGRNAVGIGVARRSGLDPELVLVSRHGRGGMAVRELLAEARALLSRGSANGSGEAAEAAGRLPYHLRHLADTLDGLADPEGRRSGVAAVAARHVQSLGGRQRLLDLFDRLRAPLPRRDGPEVTPARPVAELATLLRLARFLEVGG